MRRIVLALVVAAVGSGAPAAAATPQWTTYRHDAARSGIDPDSTDPLPPSQAWQTPGLDDQVYGQPLVYGTHVYVATENDTIYALNAATGTVAWSRHLATPEASSVAPCGDIKPTIGITGTPVIDPAANRIYAVGAVSSSGSVHHELFALDLGSGKQVAGFPIAVDPPFPSGGAPVNQLQRVGLGLDQGRILIGFGGNAGDCDTYWGWLVSAPESGVGALSEFQVDPHYDQGAVWASGNAPTIDSSGIVFIATGNGSSTDPSNPDYGDAVVKLSSSASVLDWWAPSNWRSLDSSDADLGSSMPTLLPGGYLLQSGKDGNGYVLNGTNLGHVSAPAQRVSCGTGSFGGSVYDPSDSTVYVTCGNLKALSLTAGTPPSLAPKPGFSAPSGATGPPMVAGGLVWAANASSGTLYGLDLASGAIRAQFAIPETGFDPNPFASPSAGGGRLFVASGDQVTAFTIARAPRPTPPVLSRLRVSPRRVHVSRGHRFKARVSYMLSAAATITLTVKRQVRDRKGHRHLVRVHGSIRHTSKAGTNAFTFHGRIGGHNLGGGTYRLVATPSGGGLTGAAHTTPFVIIG